MKKGKLDTERVFNKTEAKILRLLYKQKLGLTIYEVAKEAQISYPTAKKYINKLISEGILIDESKKKEKAKNR